MASILKWTDQEISNTPQFIDALCTVIEDIRSDDPDSWIEIGLTEPGDRHDSLNKNEWVLGLVDSVPRYAADIILSNIDDFYQPMKRTDKPNTGDNVQIFIKMPHEVVLRGNR